MPSARRWQSTDAAAAPSNPKIVQIVDQISQLTLLETADLVASLKVGLFPLALIYHVYGWVLWIAYEKETIY